MARSGGRGVAGQAVVSVLGAVALVGAGLAAVFGSGSPVRSLSLRDGAAWVQSLATGSLERLDTGSGAVGYRLTTPLATRPLEIVDDGTTTVLRDPATGAIRAIDLSGAKAKLTAPTELAREARLVSGAGRTFVVLAARGEVAALDPVTLAVGEATVVGGAIGAAAVDGSGVLWAAVPSLGTVVPLGVDGVRVSAGEEAMVGPRGVGVDVTVAAGQAYGLDRVGGVLLRLRPGQAAVVARVPAGSTVAAAQGDAADGHLVVGDPSGAVLRVDPVTGRVSRFEVVGRAGHRLGPPVQSRSRIVVPDHTTGELIVIDPATGTYEVVRVRTGPEPPGAQGAVEVQVTAADGAVVANDPRSPTAIVVTPAGDTRVVDKGGRAPGADDPGAAPLPVPVVLPVPDPGLRPRQGPAGPVQGPAPAGAGAVGPVPPPAAATSPPVGAARPPSPPGGVGGLEALPGNSTIDVLWNAAPDGGSPVLGHSVECARAGVVPGRAELRGGATSVTIQGLVNDLEYTCTVVASNAVGAGPAVSALPVRPRAGVPGAPSAVQAEGGNGSVIVRWAEPAAGGAPFAGYRVITTGPSGSTATEVAAAQTTVTLGGLVNGTPYEVAVRAVAPSGAHGPPGLAGGPVTPSGPPGPPQAVAVAARSRAIDVRWRPAADNGSPVTGYLVLAEPGGHRREVTGDVGSAVLDFLENDVDYTVIVVGLNHHGAGPSSEPRPARPTRPEIVRLDVSPLPGSGGIHVSFTVDWKGETPRTVGCGFTSVGGGTTYEMFGDCEPRGFDVGYHTTAYGAYSVTAIARYVGGEVRRGPVVVQVTEPPRAYLTRSMDEFPRDWFFGRAEEGNRYAEVQESGIWVYENSRLETWSIVRWRDSRSGAHFYGTPFEERPPGYVADGDLGSIFRAAGPDRGPPIHRFAREDRDGPDRGVDCFLGPAPPAEDPDGWTDDGLLGFSALPP